MALISFEILQLVRFVKMGRIAIPFTPAGRARLSGASAHLIIIGLFLFLTRGSSYPVGGISADRTRRTAGGAAWPQPPAPGPKFFYFDRYADLPELIDTP
jgi:hypothetical protein